MSIVHSEGGGLISPLHVHSSSQLSDLLWSLMISPEWLILKLPSISFKVASNVFSYQPMQLHLRHWAPTVNMLRCPRARHRTQWASCALHGRSHPLVGECEHSNVFLFGKKINTINVCLSVCLSPRVYLLL